MLFYDYNIVLLHLALPLWGFLIVWKVYQRWGKKKEDENTEKEKSTAEEGVHLESKVFVEPI